MNDDRGLVTKLLLVDDDPSMVRLLTRIIENAGRNRIVLESYTDPKAARQWMENNLIEHAEKRLERWRKALSGTFAAERDRRIIGAV